MTVVELEEKHGGLRPGWVLEELKEADSQYLKQWRDANLGEEIKAWLRSDELSADGRALCSKLVAGKAVANDLFNALYSFWKGKKQLVIEWNRLSPVKHNGRTCMSKRTREN